ncbi:conserved Plasmodium protein, unknown function [Plasmodium ovale]|uniref:Uncharacterized protein n=1 Tax=Plasmodium ovale TaxID=36330 RepID=A0A1C3KU65_PLAOA|nr:conserved Plasmodium protein, unknown function [Plasmodium ovale]
MNNVWYVYLIVCTHLFVASLCYQIIYVDSFEDSHENEFENVSCSWRYFCHGHSHICEHGCCSKKKLRKGYNLLNTSALQEKCFVNIECDKYDIYFDSEDPTYIYFFSNIFFHINPGFTLYVHLRKRSAQVKKDEFNTIDDECNGSNRINNFLSIHKKVNKYRSYISNRFRKTLTKLLLFFLLLHIIFLYLFIYTYLHLKRYDEIG